MNTRLRRLTASVTFAAAFALAPVAQADERGDSLRAFWAAFQAWFSPPTTPAPRLEAITLEEGVMIDPHGRSATTPPAPAEDAATENSAADPLG
jgi:hypothetical protein